MYGMTLAQWIREPANFGEREIARINKRIEEYDVGVELIVFGYDSRNVPHVFTVIEPGTSENRDHEPFVVIGSGGLLAHKSLLSRDLPLASQAEMMCRVLEAKFCAEDDDGVGADCVRGRYQSTRMGEIASAGAVLEKSRDASRQNSTAKSAIESISRRGYKSGSGRHRQRTYVRRNRSGSCRLDETGDLAQDGVMKAKPKIPRPKGSQTTKRQEIEMLRFRRSAERSFSRD